MRQAGFHRAIAAATVPALTILVWVAGSPGMSEAPIAHPTRLPAWWTEAGPVVATFGALRIVVAAWGLYWSALFVVVLVARWSGRPEVLAKRCLRHRSFGLSWAIRLLAGASVASTTVLTGTAGRFSDATINVVGSAPAPSPAPAIPPRLVPLSLGSSAPSPPPLPSAAPAPPRSNIGSTSSGLTAASPQTDLADEPREWIVKRGDDLWSIAGAALATYLGRPPSDREIGPYWLKLIDANRDRLPDPDNPSLIFAGEPITLPAP